MELAARQRRPASLLVSPWRRSSWRRHGSHPLKLQLIDDWHKAHRFISVWAMSLAGVAEATWRELPDDLHAAAPTWLHSAILYALLALGITGRLVKQGKPDANVPPQ